MAFNLFNTIRVKTPKRHAFDLSHDVKMSCDLYKLVPILCEEVVPGDTWKVNTEILMRFAPLVSPVMHRLNVYTHFFFVPKRLLWDGWKDYITGGEYRPGKKDPNEAPAYPRLEVLGKYVDSGLLDKGSLADYLGFPVGDSVTKAKDIYNCSVNDGSKPTISTVTLDALPFRAYNLIWNEYYRDQNLQDPIDIHQEISGVHDGLAPLCRLLFRAWEKDYFTSALPWPQAGDDVLLPLHGNATSHTVLEKDVVIADTVRTSLTGQQPGGKALFMGRTSEDIFGLQKGPLMTTLQQPDGHSTSENVALSNSVDVNLRGTVDLSNVSAATINEFRRAVRAQEFLEKSARGGSRYIEQLLSFFGVRSSDARLQRPEYLGGGKSPVVISDVAQTSQTTQDGSPQGNLSGQAASLQRSHSFKRYFEEHGYIIGIMSILPRTCYQQGMPRKYMKTSREDEYWPTFANLGEQEIKNSEIYFDASDGENDDTFGYTPRYAEYKYLPSRVCGDFRDTLSYWHMGRIFKKRPHLNRNFITSSGDGRIFADTNDDYQKLWVNIYHNITAVRPMPIYGTPML